MELLRGGSHDGQIHAADQFGMFSGQRIEGAVAQHDGAAAAVWSYPFSVEAWQVQARSRSGLRRAPAEARAWSARLRPSRPPRLSGARRV